MKSPGKLLGNSLRKSRSRAAIHAFGLLGLLSFVSACSGDGRPLEEAIEINELGLRSISISQPASFLQDLTVNTGERVRFRATGLNQASELVELSTAQRRWSVLTPSSVSDGTLVGSPIANIDENGNFVASSQGDVVVRLQIGGLASNFPVQISNETLVEITEIVGDATIERCIPKEYSAIGTFSGGSVRALPDLAWRVLETGLGTVVETDTVGAIAVNAFNPGALQLVASMGEVSVSKMITVLDTLQAITVTPEVLSLREDDTLTLGATGVYVGEAGSRRVAITENVIWGVPVSNGVATVSNVAPTIGVVTSRAVGSTRVTAFCGLVSEEKALVVVDSNNNNDDDDDDDDGLL